MGAVNSADDRPTDGTGKPLVLNARGEWVNEIGDTRCPNDGEFTNVRCWKCGWEREALPRLMDEDERVALDKHGATVIELAPGLFEVWCNSHATQLKSDDRRMLERRAATHNANWHPGL